jgi:thiol-disulfide isomerase/thioredoxin/tRNA A-37 threonylcarbamoyl transferase component Bud32
MAMPMKRGTPMPSLEGATGWFNATGSGVESSCKSHPVLVHFWAVSCGICKQSLPQVAEWRETYKDKGLRVIAIHMPRYEEDTDTEVVREWVARLKMSEPCAIDNEHELRDAFQNEHGHTPFYYLFDPQGKLVAFAAGERGASYIGPALESLFAGPYCQDCDLVLKPETHYCPKCGQPLSPLPETVPAPVKVKPTAPLSPGPLSGRVLDGKYELVALIGKGGMSVVYRARRTHLHDEVAVKILLPEFVQDESAIERFRREARAAAMLRHPNVVSIHDFGEGASADMPAYIAMELVEGQTLRRLLRNEGALPVRRALELMGGICAGVATAHRREIVHRDLKPDNVIILPADEDHEREIPKVVDFGIAKLRDQATLHLTESGALVGTPYYMSPEQCRGEDLDIRSDVYSLGAMLYEMLSGVAPFKGKNVTSIIAKHLFEEPAPLPQTFRVAPELEAAIRRALAKDPNKRPANAAEFARELRVAF